MTGRLSSFAASVRAGRPGTPVTAFSRRSAVSASLTHVAEAASALTLYRIAHAASRHALHRPWLSSGCGAALLASPHAPSGARPLRPCHKWRGTASSMRAAFSGSVNCAPIHSGGMVR